jgi:hypothetical protein
MQSFAFLWFQLQMTKQYLREKTFGPEQPPANPTNLDTPIGAGTPPLLSFKQVLPMASPMERRVSDSLSQNLIRLIGSRFGKFANNQGKHRREAVRSSR